MYYPDDLVEEIRLRSDIVDVVGSYVHLKRSGSDNVGLCPFHNEKTGSFHVNSQRQIFKCFGCGVGGNVITFLMKYENMTFPEAIKVLADRAGVALPEMEYSEEQKRANNRKQRILEINKEAAKYYFAALRSPQGESGYNYLKGRGLSDETIKNFGLGFAVLGQNSLYKYLKALPEKYDDDILNACKIFYFNENGGARDIFWNRVIFPIMDANNKVIAFGGRLMSEGAIEQGDKKIPKYLNSPETDVFEKSRNLYGLNIAKRTKADYFILCEGYMDVIALHQAGFDMAVASLGTAFTSGHANLVSRYQKSKKVYLSYDSDEAGTKAALRALPILRAAGITAKIINMQPYKDPDEFIKNLGEEEYRRRIDNAEGSFFFEIRMLEQGYDLSDPDSKTKFYQEVARRILRYEDEIERENHSEAFCSKYGVSKSSFEELVKKQALRSENLPERIVPKSGIHERAGQADRITSAEKITSKTLLSWMYDEPKIFDIVKKYIKPSDFEDELYIKAAGLFYDQIEAGASEIDVAKIIGCFTEEDEQTEVASLFSQQYDLENANDKPASLRNILVNMLEKSCKRLAVQAEAGDMLALQRGFEVKSQINEIKTKKIDVWG